MTWHKVAQLNELQDDSPFAVDIEDESVALYKVDGKLFATGNICTHEHAYLTDGYLDGDCIECPLHGGRFHIGTGEPCGGPVKTGIRVYPVKVEQDEIFVELD
jgi:nitrite reductase/ring-hydroxylating ferredoxin subunit